MMVCEIARGLDEAQVDDIRQLEDDIGLTVVAFACRSLDPVREQRLQAIQAEFGPPLTAEPARPSDEQLSRLRELEAALGLSLVAVQLDPDDHPGGE